MSATQVTEAPAGLASPQTPLMRPWRLLSNVRFALGLILVLVLLTFAGTGISQIPPPMRSDQMLVDRWVVAMERQYGAFAAPLMYRLGLFDIFNASGYRALLGVLTVSVIACTLKRWPAIWRGVFDQPLTRPIAFFEHADPRARTSGLAMSPSDAGEQVAAIMRKAGYRATITRASDGGIHVFADRYRLFRLATFVNHLGLVLLLAGGATTGIFGQRNDGFVIPVGATRPVGLGTTYSLRVDTFVDEYYLAGGAKDYRSEVVVFDDGREVQRATIRVNEPLVVGPVRLHQAYFGQAVAIEVRKRENLIFQDSIPLAFTALPYGFRSVGFFRLPSEGLSIDLVGPDGADDATVRPGQIAMFGYPLGGQDPLFGGVLTQRTASRWNDLEFTFTRESQFAGLQAVRDPGAPLFFIAAGLMLGGILAVFYFPHRRVWALARLHDGDGTRVWVAGATLRDPGFADEFRGLIGSIEARFSSQSLRSS
ncbi:MAG: hypothetical protein EPO26_08730 [Chloroflexota bacterium]|nr:MAG: hypothetical protein EPO26_08730 [Chloroflexota bacterium]